MPHKKAALVIYNEDIDLLKNQYELGQFDIYDSVYIFDGPYEYINNKFLYEKESIKLSDTDFGRELLKNDKFIYSWRIYKDEHDKRIASYDAIDEEIIFLRDTDEFIDFDPIALKEFIEDDFYGVASYGCQNLSLNGVAFGKSIIKSVDQLPARPLCFKKKLISAKEHLNYLWLINVAQERPNQNLFFPKSIGFGYHFTQMRSYVGQITKFDFYTALHFSVAPPEGFVLSVLENMQILLKEKKISHAEVQELFLSSNSDFTLAPPIGKGEFLFERLPGSKFLNDAFKIVDAQKYVVRAGEILLYSGLARYVFIYPESKKIRIKSPVISILHIVIYKYTLNSRPVKILDEKYEGSFRFNFDEENLLVGHLISITPTINSQDRFAKFSLDM